LRVFASNLNLQVSQEFSFTKTPHVIVAEAVRASMSIPLFFEAMTLSQGPFKNQLFVDGGLTYNYPITTFDETVTNLKTLGFHFGKVNKKPKENALKTDEVLDYTKILFDMLLDTQKIDFEKDPAEKERTINIDDFGISATNFELTEVEKQQLYHAGKIATKHFLKTHEKGANSVLIH
jgi:NTE family protein